MKNIHILPTDKPSRLYLFEERLILGHLVTVVFKNSGAVNQHIYITSEEHPKPNDFYFDFENQKVKKCETGYYNKGSKKIILTTEQELIKDGVQAIDDEFLEWFVKNPSCEEVEVEREKAVGYAEDRQRTFYGKYKIIIPKEEPKQNLPYWFETQEWKDFSKLAENNFGGKPKMETLEEAAKTFATRFTSRSTPNWESFKLGFIEGAKWQQEQDKNKYSEEDMIKFGFSTYCYISELMGVPFNLISENRLNAEEWFEQFKKK